MNSRMRKHAALAVVTLAAAGALTLAACAETPAASSDAPAIQNQSKSEESMTNERNGGYAHNFRGRGGCHDELKTPQLL